MPMTQTRFVPYEMKKSVVRVYSYEDQNISGTLINPHFKEDVHFKSTTQLLKLIDYLQDSLNFPQKSMLARGFTGVDGGISPEEFAVSSEAVQPGQKPLASFEISILFRQNASWQGSIVWMEKTLSAEFRSVLEMIFLIDGVLADYMEGGGAIE